MSNLFKIAYVPFKLKYLLCMIIDWDLILIQIVELNFVFASLLFKILFLNQFHVLYS